MNVVGCGSKDRGCQDFASSRAGSQSISPIKLNGSTFANLVGPSTERFHVARGPDLGTG